MGVVLACRGNASQLTHESAVAIYHLSPPIPTVVSSYEVLLREHLYGI